MRKKAWTSLLEWEELPEIMRTSEVKKYYEILKKKQKELYIKRMLDIMFSGVLLIVCFPIMLVIALVIYKDSKGPIFYRQERVTQYGRKFQIFKFRTMVQNADKVGAAVTSGEDGRITKIGKKLRKYRLDELPQIFNILLGDMTIVGTRPEVSCYVEQYTSEMWATLLLPAGVTSLASIKYKDEAELLSNTEDVNKVYVENILPSKMKYNLYSLKEFSFLGDIGIMIRTVFEVLK